MKYLFLFFLSVGLGVNAPMFSQKAYKPIRVALKAKNASQALRVITPLLTDSTYRGDARLHEYAIEAYTLLHEKENTKAYLRQPYDTLQFFKTSLGITKHILALDTLDRVNPQKKARVLSHKERAARFLAHINAAGRYYFKQKKYAEAIHYFTTFLDAPNELFPWQKVTREKYVETAYLCSKSYFLNKNYKEVGRYAFLLYNDSLYACPSLELYALSAEHLGDTLSYLTHLRKGIESCQSSAFFFTRLADYYIGKHQPQYVLHLADSLLAADSLLVVAMEGRCLALMSLKKYTEVITQAERLLQLAPSAINPHYYIGASLCYLAEQIKAGNNINSKHFKKSEQKRKALFKQALPYLEQFRQLAPEKKEMWGTLLYQAYLSLGDEEKFKEIEKTLHSSYSYHIPSKTMEQNPFLVAYNTPHNTIPFDKISLEHFAPALREAMRREREEIAAIVDNINEPTFENTILALENSGSLLQEITTVMHNLNSAETSDDLDSLVNEFSPILSEHSSEIMQNEQLFERIRKVYEKKHLLSGEEAVLVQKVYDNFERSGATLSAEKKARFKEIKKELAVLGLRFSQNRLKETNAYELLLTKKDEIAGLPESFLAQAAEAAEAQGKKGWLVTLKAPSYIPFMMYADNRKLREELYMAYNTLCTHDNEYNNFEVVRQIVNLRLELAQLLGYSSYAEYALKNRMAEKPAAVHELLNNLLSAYQPTAQKEVEKVEDYAHQLAGEGFTLEPWDFAYYSQKLKQEKYDIDPEVLRQYFSLEKVEKGVFDLAHRLYGITFRSAKDISVYHPEVNAYEVYDKDGSFLAVLYTDYFPREGKQSGAWMTGYRGQYIDTAGVNHRPHVSLTCNFTRPTATQPALLTFEEVETLLHEFGHCLHGIFANSRFESLSGTNVLWDFVELPSQIMENYAVQKEFLQTFATHYETGEVIPDSLITKVVAARNSYIAYACLRQLSFGFLDMALYERTTPLEEGQVLPVEKEAMKKAALLPVPSHTSMTTNFGHIISGGYAAGYYSYKWAEVLDADAFDYFREQGIFNPKVANSFREHILSRGNTAPPSQLYLNFRGKPATIDGLLKRDGIKQ